MSIQRHTQRTRARQIAFALAVLGGLAPLAGAKATRGLPQQIRTGLNLDYLPQCSLCHQEGKTGNGTVTTPFALSARARGLTGSGGGGRNSTNSNVSTTLAQMTSDQVDSDGDGVTDVNELIAGTDPNVFGPVPITQGDPSYGCSAAAEATSWPALLLALAFGFRRASPRLIQVSD